MCRAPVPHREERLFDSRPLGIHVVLHRQNREDQQDIGRLQNLIVDIVSQRLSVRYCQPDDDNDLREAALTILGIDGEEDIYFYDRQGRRRATKYLEAVLTMIQQARFDSTTKEWVYHAPQRNAATRQRLSHGDMLASIATPLSQIFVARRWPNAALSRWIGVMTCLKRVALGMIMNNILGDVLAGLVGKLDISEKTIKQQTESNEKKLVVGAEVNANAVVHDSRILKLSKYFRSLGQKWQVAVILRAAALVDKIHWGILGHSRRRQAANLDALVDVKGSLIAEVLSTCKQHLEDWSLDGSWKVLRFFSA